MGIVDFVLRRTTSMTDYDLRAGPPGQNLAATGDRFTTEATDCFASETVADQVVATFATSLFFLVFDLLFGSRAVSSQLSEGGRRDEIPVAPQSARENFPGRILEYTGNSLHLCERGKGLPDVMSKRVGITFREGIEPSSLFVVLAIILVILPIKESVKTLSN